MSEKDKKLIEIYSQLQAYEKNTIELIKSYEDEIKKYQDSNKEILEEEVVEIYTEAILKLTSELEKIKQDIKEIKNLYSVFDEQNNKVQNLVNFNTTLGDMNAFTDILLSEHLTIDPALFEKTSNYSKITGIKAPFNPKELNEMNKTHEKVTFLMLKIKPLSPAIIVLDSDKRKMADEIKKVHLPLAAFYSKLVKFLKDVKTAYESKIEELAEKIQESRDNEIKNRRNNIKKNIDELNDKIDSCRETLDKINDAYKLYEEYGETHSQSTLLELTNQLSSLLLISPRDSKLLTYVPKEKVEPKVEEPKTEIKEEPNNKPVEVKKLDSDYFRRSSTKHIICFLGDKENEILDDIDSHFDGKNKMNVLTEMESLFEYLYTNEVNNDNYIETGGNPKYFSDPLAKQLCEKLGFNYKRFGVGKDQYRIHAIERYSELLKELGFGSGYITFFGAVGVNDTKLKSDAYHRIGSRAIESLSSGGGAPKLRPNFDYVEHITKKQIPFELLSENDKNNKKNGKFNGKIKGTKIDKSYESMKYFHYDILDDESKNNVKKYLDDYFLNQTNSMFEILDVRKKLKGESLD